MSSTTTPDAPAASTSRTLALRVLAVLMLVGVVLQALWAGGFLGPWADWGVDAHELGANATFTVAVAQLVLVLTTPAFRADRKLVAGVIAIVATLTAIIGLGYAARSSRSTLLFHVPLAVVVAIGTSDHLRSANRVARGDR